MFGFEQILMIALAIVAAGVSWLLLYDNDTKTWKSPTDPILMGGYALVAGCTLGVFILMNFHPFSKDGEVKSEAASEMKSM
jgi:hypothetical protein